MDGMIFKFDKSIAKTWILDTEIPNKGLLQYKDAYLQA